MGLLCDARCQILTKFISLFSVVWIGTRLVNKIRGDRVWPAKERDNNSKSMGQKDKVEFRL